MGNCQAIDTATLVIQHPCGRSEKLYWSVSANEIMKMNPGHYVALLISTTSVCPPPSAAASSATAAAGTTPAAPPPNSVRVTRIKLLRPTDTLALGQVYRLITAKEVMKVLSAKKYAKMKKGQVEEKLMSSGLEIPAAPRRSDNNNHHLHHSKKPDTQVAKPERHSRNSHQQHKTTSSTPRPRTWQPSLNSISESAS